MRREFILILLGIICISTLSSLLSGYVQIIIVDSDKVLLDTVVGAVGAGNFSYWQLGHTGPLLVGLTSITGDADLYVSDTVRPSYEVDKNNFSSATCGSDVVHIPADFPRPIGQTQLARTYKADDPHFAGSCFMKGTCIGVFGHWGHHLSEYSIQVFLDAATARGEEQLLAAGQVYESQDRPDADRRREKPAARRTEEEAKPRFLKLLSILDMVFEMFVL